MLRSITADEFLWWEAYQAVEPFGSWFDNYRTATIVQALRNLFRGEKQKPVPLEDCLLVPRVEGEEKAEESKQQPWQFKKAIAYAIAAAYAKVSGTEKAKDV